LSNDTLEGKLLVESLRRLAKRDHLDAYTIWELQRKIDVFEKIFDGLGFCLSKDGDLLSQWRGYAADATGVAIGFSREYLETQCAKITQSNSEHFSLVPVEYEPDQHDLLVGKTYENILPYIKQGALRSPHLNTLLDPQPDEQRKVAAALLEKLLQELHGLAPLLFRLKSVAFKEEHEMRLFSYLLKDGSDLCSYRAIRNCIIPYRPFALILESHPIEEVILGPKNTSPLWTVKNFLKHCGFGEVSVSLSKASYR
jgi:hypothetical protein